LTVADRYTENTEALIANKEKFRKRMEESEGYVEERGLGQLTDKYLMEGLSEDDSFQQACEDKGVALPKRRWRYDY